MTGVPGHRLTTTTIDTEAALRALIEEPTEKRYASREGFY
jgi:hypothetical protein